MRYLLGQDFASLASQRTGKANPTFYDMKAQGFKALTKQDLLVESLFYALYMFLCVFGFGEGEILALQRPNREAHTVPARWSTWMCPGGLGA